MSHTRISVKRVWPNPDFLRILGLLGLAWVLGACAPSALTPRLPAYLPAQTGSSVSGITLPARQNIDTAVYVLSDDSVPELAPALPDSMLTILRNRLVQRLRENPSVNAFPMDPLRGLAPGQISATLVGAAEGAEKPYLVLAVFSSVEQESAIHLGAQPIMTQMPGLAVENSALAELALVHVGSQRIVFQAEGRSSATMEELTVPLGESNKPGVDGRGILRANAAQAALDRALIEFQKQWTQRSLIQ